MKIYSCGPSNEDNRPMIDFTDPSNCKNDWLTIADVISGDLPLGAFPGATITVDDPRAMEWDSYADGGVRGLFSERFILLLGPEALRYFTPLRASLNGNRFYFLRCDTPLDCLDRGSSEFTTFDCDPDAIKTVTHFAFDVDRIPGGTLFCIPEMPDLFASEAAADRIRMGRLRGIDLKLLR